MKNSELLIIIFIIIFGIIFIVGNVYAHFENEKQNILDKEHNCYGSYKYVESKDACCEWKRDLHCGFKNPDGSCASVVYENTWGYKC